MAIWFALPRRFRGESKKFLCAGTESPYPSTSVMLTFLWLVFVSSRGAL